MQYFPPTLPISLVVVGPGRHAKHDYAMTRDDDKNGHHLVGTQR